jgi:ATP-dependent RNA helicase DHX29
MQGQGRNYNEHETSAVEDFAVALLCGNVSFKVRIFILSHQGLPVPRSSV